MYTHILLNRSVHSNVTYGVSRSYRGLSTHENFIAKLCSSAIRSYDGCKFIYIPWSSSRERITLWRCIVIGKHERTCYRAAVIFTSFFLNVRFQRIYSYGIHDVDMVSSLFDLFFGWF